MSGAKAEIVGGNVVVTPAAGFFGQTTFSYQVADGTNDPDRYATGNVQVTVTGRPSAPGAPTGKVSSKTVDLTWGVPSANGGPIDYYTVMGDSGLSQQCPTNSCQIGNLNNGTVYRFRVSAHNAAGDGTASAASAPLKPDAIPGVPLAPTTQFGDKQITVTWRAPANDGTPISGYVLNISPVPPDGVASKTINDGSTTSTVWAGLLNGTPYAFAVKAINGAGPSELSRTQPPKRLQRSPTNRPPQRPSAATSRSLSRGPSRSPTVTPSPPTNSASLETAWPRRPCR